MKLVIKIVGALVLVIAIVAGVALLRTSQFAGKTSTQAAVTLPEPPAADVGAAAEMLGAAIRIQTVTYAAGDPQPGADQPWIDLRAALQARYAALFAASTLELVADHAMLLTWAGSDPALPPIILMAHQDVVPVNPGTDGDWTHGPFGGVVADGYIWGRGAMDDKGALIALLEAGDALAKSGWSPKRTVMFAFGHDEEVSGKGAQAIFTLLKSRNVKPMMVLDEGFFVLEDNPMTGKSTAMIGVAEKGSVSVSITANTVGGHSSQPPLNSGSVRIAKAILALENNQMPMDLSAPPFGEMMQALAPDLAFATKLALANRWLLEGAVKAQLTEGVAAAMVRTTTAPTMMTGSIKENVLPQRANAVVNFRIHPNDSIEKVLQHVRDVTAGIPDLTIETLGGMGGGMEPSGVSATSGEAWDILRAVASAAGGGVPATPALVIAATDARFASVISTDAVYRFQPAIYGNADIGGFHGTNERLSVDNLGRMIKGYGQIMMAMCGS